MRADQMPIRNNDFWGYNPKDEIEEPTPSIVNDRGPILKDDITNLKIQMETDTFFTGE